jgi:diadenosine tetraphosphate (Ap4A) HIT family hydrolase
MQAKPPITMSVPSPPHPTLLKFGYPANLLHQGRHWALLVRPAQPTLGSLVLCALDDIRAYGEMPAEAFAEQGEMVGRIERFLGAWCNHEKINYLMLMMVDPQVHFHIIPRYPGERVLHGASYVDHGWPGLPDLATSVPASGLLIHELQQRWTDPTSF